MTLWINKEDSWRTAPELWISDAIPISTDISLTDFPKRLQPLVSSRLSDVERKLYANDPSRTNRAHQIRRSNDEFKNISVKLQDIDEAILFYFNNVIKPKVIDNGIEINLPVRYSNPESWEFIQKRGYMSDKKGKAIIPAVIVRRTSITKDDNVPIDKADRNIVRQFPIKWSNKNKYDRFSLLTGGFGRQKTYEVFNVVVPDYVTINYDCIIWTSYITQMNKIIEQIYYSEGQYWGDEKKYKFSTRIDSFDQAVEISTDKGRVVKSNFSLNVKGYLIPEVANDLITTQKTFTKQQIILENETEIDILSLSQTDPLSQKILVTTNKQPALSGNQTITDLVNTAIINFQAQINYLRKMSVYSSLTAPGATVESGSISVVTYPNVYTASVPTQSSLLATREEDFLVFVNGQYMEHDAFTIQQSGSNFVINANTGSLGYELNDTDEIVVWGKFDG